MDFRERMRTTPSGSYNGTGEPFPYQIMVKRFSQGDSGMTAMEVTIAVCVILLLALVTAKPITSLVQRIRLQNAADGMKHLIQTARMRAVSSPDRYCGVVFRFHRGAADDTVFAFLDASPSDKHYVAGQDQAYLSPYVIPKTQKIISSVPAGYPTELVFRSDGSAIASGKVALTLKGFKDTLDVLASTGRVKVIKH
jgi:Tfp pilus assembly protein FimT